MKQNKTKKVLACVLSVLAVAAYVPANVGTGGIFGGTEIVANAEEVTQRNYCYLVQGISGSTEITNHNVRWDEDEGAAYFSGSSSYLEILGQPFKGKVGSTTGFVISFDAKVESGANRWARFFDICNMKYESGDTTNFYNSAKVSGKSIFMNAGDLQSDVSPCLGYSYSQGTQAQTRLYNHGIDHTEMKNWHNYKVVVDTNAKTYFYYDNKLVGTTENFVQTNSTDTGTIIRNSLNDMGAYENYLIGASMWGPNDGYFKGYMKNLQLTCNSKSLIVTPPSAKALYYTGEAQTLIDAGSTTGGNVMYKLSTSNTWSSSLPQATEAGSYTVEYYGKATDAAYEDSSVGSITVTIAENGKLFAGYFTDSTCQTAYLGDDVAYSKYVDAETYLNLTNRVNASVSADGKKADLTFSVLAPDTNFQNVRFEIKVAGKTKKVQIDRLVKTDEGCQAIYTLKGVLKKYFGKEITITPTWKTLDGTTVTGTPTTYTITP